MMGEQHRPMWRIKLEWFANWAMVIVCLGLAAFEALWSHDAMTAFLLISVSMVWLREAKDGTKEWYERRLWEIDRMREGLDIQEGNHGR